MPKPNKKSDLILQGNIPKAIVALAGPMFISAILQTAQNLIDLFWVGKLGSVSVAALTISGVIMMAIFPIQMGVATGTVALVSRAFGSGLPRRASAMAAQSLILGFFVALGLAAVFLPFLPDLCTLLGAEREVVTEAVLYLRANLYGMATGVTLFLASTALQASGNTVTPMLALLSANVFNMALDPLFIFGFAPIGMPGFGVSGAAWATVLANGIGAVGLIFVMGTGRTRLRLRYRDFRPDWRTSLSLLRIGLPSMAQMTSRSLMGLVFMKVIARFGTDTVAGYGIGMRIHQVLLMPCFVLGNATATMVGQNLGASQPLRARSCGWTSAAMIAGLVTTAALIVNMTAAHIVSTFNSDPQVVGIGSGFLRTVTPFYIFTGVSIVLDRALNGAGCTVATMVFTIVVLWGLQVPLALLFSKWFTPPVNGVWWAINTANVVHSIMSVSWFAVGRWMRKKIAI